MNRQHRIMAVVAGAALFGTLGTPLARAADPSPVAEWSDQFVDAPVAEAWLAAEAEENGTTPEALAADLLVQAQAADVSAPETAIAEDLLETRPTEGMSEADAQALDEANLAARQRRDAANALRATEPSSAVPAETPAKATFEDDDLAMETRGGSGSDLITIPKAAYGGDIFYYPSYTAGINHGHVAIFRSRSVIVEAANENLGVRRVSNVDRRVPKGKTNFYWVGGSSTAAFIKQLDAAAWADDRVGAAYRPWYVTKNKFYTAPSTAPSSSGRPMASKTSGSTTTVATTCGQPTS